MKLFDYAKFGNRARKLKCWPLPTDISAAIVSAAAGKFVLLDGDHSDNSAAKDEI